MEEEIGLPEEDSGVAGNICTRCGNIRVVETSTEEIINGSKVVFRTMICSNPECQSVVDTGLAKEEQKRILIKSEQEKREAARKNSKIRGKAE